MSWLKDRWEELNAQVKMGDNKTASTVRAARKPAAPAQTMRANTNQPGWSVRKPQPAPLTTQQRISQSYGPTGFTGLKNYAKDMLFDNNSEADRIKRYAATGLNESYDQEQARKTKEAQASNDKLGTIHQVMKSVPAGAGFLAKTPGAIGQMQGRTAKMVNEIDNPLLRTGAKLVSAPLGGLMTTKQADTNIKTGRGLNERIDNKIQQSAFGDRADDNKYVTGAGKMFGQLGGQIATGGLGTVAIGSQMAADEANKAEAAGKSNTYSTLTGFGQGGIGALSEKYGVDKFIPGKGNVAGNFVTRMGKRIFTEGAQEAQQQFTQNYIANKAYNPNQSLKEGVLESALMGGLAGGAMSPAVDIMNRPTAPKPTTSLVAPKPEPTRTRLRPEEARIWSDYQETLYKGNRMPAQVVNETHNKARQIADSLGVDIITGSPDEIAGRMNPLLEQSMAFQKEPTTSLVRPRALNQSGYIQLPGGQDTQLNDTELGVLNYLNNKPVQEGSATQGEGNALPTELSAGKRQSYLDKMKKMVTPLNEGGYIAGPLALDFNKAKAKGLVFDGVDGKPRFEVSDRNAKLVNDGQTADALMNGETVQLDEVLDHPDLYKQYPELQFTNFKLDKTIEGDAEFAGNTIRVNPDNMTDDQSIVETILHEVQHNVQDIEGFASGGNKGRGGNKRYQNLAGEAEARAVASRMNMPMSERYVKPEGETFYHGTTEKWQGDEPKFPLYTTPSKKYAQVFADSTAASSIGKSGIKKADGSMVREFKLNPKARILDATNPKVRAMLDKEYFGRYSVSDKFYPGKNGHLDWTEGENLAEFIAEKKLPYDAVKLDEGGGGLDPQFGVMVDDKGTSVLALNKDAISPNKPRSTFYDSLDVPKQDLIIRNGDGKAMSIDPLESLKAEAKPATGARSDYSPENLQANRQIRAKNASSITYADKKTINPDELVTVYRAVPGKAKGGLVEGDWVTPNKEQARLFMKQSWAQDDTGAKIVTKKVKASELRYHADDAKGYVDDELLYVPKATQSQPPKSAAKIVEATDTRKADRWATPLPDTGKTPIPKKLDTNGVQIKEGDKIEFYGASPGGKKGTATIRWEGPHRANASGKEFPGKWLGNGTLDNNIPFTVVERNGKPFAPTKPPTPFEQNLQTAGLMPKKSKGVVLAEGKTAGGQRVRKTLRGPGQSSVDTVAQDVQRGIKAESSAIADALGIPLEDRTPSAQNQRPLEKIVRTAETETMQDVFDQKDYGVKEISNTPNHTYSDLFEKHLGIKGMSEVDLNKSNRTGVKKVRDAVGKANPLRAVDKGVGTMFEKLSRSNKLGRAISRTAQYINKTAGQDPMVLEASKRLAGDGTHTDAMLVELGQKAYSLVPSTDSRARVHAVLDPEGTNAGLKYKDLTTQEQQAADTLRDIGETINDASFRAGMITRKKWESNRGGRYIARMYNELENAPDVADYLDIPDSRGLFLGMYKTRVEMNDVLRQKLVRDPVKLAVIRARQVRSNEALMEYMRTADVAGYVKQAPTKGYIKVKASEGERMHNWRGKYVRQDVYENVNGFTSLHKSANAMNDLLDLYDGNPARKLRKKMLTIYNPVVRTGNIASNYFFAYLNGVNPVTYQKNKMWAKKAIKGNDPLVLEARKAGLIGNNIVASDKNLFDKDKEFMRDVSKMDSQKLGDRVKSVDDKMSNRYGMADDLAKLSALKAHVDRGYSVRQAITKTGRGFQDYSRVGHLYDMAAKSPVFGNAFIRFQGDLYTNIIKNAAVDHPIRLASIPFATLMIGNALSALSGENEEDKKTREDRLGAPKIPFTDISTEFQTPWGAVDVARFTPLYMRNVLTDNDGDGSNKKGIMDDISRLAPVNLPANMSKEEWARSAATDPLLGPLISMVTDVDWRGKSVRDPDGVRDGKQLFPEEKLTTTEKAQNIAQYGVRSYAPYPFNEVGDILASVNQNKRNEQVAPGTKGDPFDPNATMLGRTGYNTSGSKKTVGQSIARLGGVRAQQFGAKEAEGQRERNDMFKFFGEIDKWKDDLSGTVKSAFEARHKSNATRSGIKKEFTEDPWYKYKNAGELLQNPELFEAEKQYALKQNKYDGKPIDPLFDLPPAQRNIVLAKKLKLPGSKDEGFNTLYDQEWYQDFRKKQDTYYASKDQYKAKMGFADIKETNPYPEADQRVQKDMDYYFSLPSGTGERSSFIRNNPKVWEAITGQWDKQNAWTDEERKRLGLPAINREDDKKYSSSGGKRGGRGGKGKASKFDYTKNLFDSGSDSASTSKQLRAILEKAMSGKS